jgi:hypothetical protein
MQMEGTQGLQFYPDSRLGPRALVIRESNKTVFPGCWGFLKQVPKASLIWV